MIDEPLASWEWIVEQGEAMFGSRWQRPLARALGIHYNLINKWNPSSADHRTLARYHYLHIKHLRQLMRSRQPIDLI